MRFIGFGAGGGSMWQSLQRQAGSAGADYLNGEIVLLGRQHGVPAPANELLQQLATTMAADCAAPGSVSPKGFLARLAR
jgi:2-dehydropantoate 2-reductase